MRPAECGSLFGSTAPVRRDARCGSRGQGVLEYMVVLALLALVLIAAVPHIVTALTSSATNAQSGMSYTGGAGNGAGAPYNVGNIYPNGAVVEYNGTTYTATTTVPSNTTPGTSVDWTPYSPPAGGAAQTTASMVYGQDGQDFTCGVMENTGSGCTAGSAFATTATNLYGPRAVAVSSGKVYIGDGPSRVLGYTGGSTTATTVYGQSGSFTCGVPDNTGSGCTASSTASATNLNGPPQEMAVDSSGDVYIVDYGNNRVLGYTGGSTTATKVYGQSGSFTCGVPDNTGSGCTASSTASATNLNNPTGVAVDSSGDVYIADTDNNRVLEYTGGSTTATKVYGQAGSFTCAVKDHPSIGCGGTTPSATNLYWPESVAVDGSGDVYIVDYGNNRVLEYTGGSTTATTVWGQHGLLTCGASDNTGAGCVAGPTITAANLYDPGAVAVDGSGNVYISDYGNNRVLYYSVGSTTATTVYGQFGNLASGVIDNNGSGGATTTPSAGNLDNPDGVAVDSSGNLYVGDSANNRVLEYPHS